jgi:hypothetical protein
MGTPQIRDSKERFLCVPVTSVDDSRCRRQQSWCSQRSSADNDRSASWSDLLKSRLRTERRTAGQCTNWMVPEVRVYHPMRRRGCRFRCTLIPTHAVSHAACGFIQADQRATFTPLLASDERHGRTGSTAGGIWRPPPLSLFPVCAEPVSIRSAKDSLSSSSGEALWWLLGTTHSLRITDTTVCVTTIPSECTGRAIWLFGTTDTIRS